MVIKTMYALKEVKAEAEIGIRVVVEVECPKVVGLESPNNSIAADAAEVFENINKNVYCN